MRSDVLFFFGVIAFFFILWYSSGGPTKPISFAGPYISPITDVDSVSEGYGDGTAYSPSGSGSIWADIMNLQGGVASLQRKSSDIRAFGEESPKRGSVVVSGFGGVGATDPEEEYVSIRNASSEDVDITGWRIVSGASGKGGRIPQGASLPRPGRVNDTDRIILAPGDEVTIVTGESPIGISFRENLCSGYFIHRQDFTPALQTMCPSAYEEFDRFYEANELRDDTCYALVQSTPACTTPEENGRLSGACLSLIDDHLTYSGCVATHQYDWNFRVASWRVYLELDKQLWKPSRDAVKIIDENGLTVDLATY